MSTVSKKKKKKVAAFAAKKLLKLILATLVIVGIVTSIIATFFFVSFINTEKNDGCTVKLRTQHQTKASTIKVGDASIIQRGYLPITALNGVVSFRVVGDSKNITISNPSGTEIMEVVPNSNIVIINGVWKRTNDIIMYKEGECYLPIDLVDKYTCLSVSYDEDNSLYTISSVGTKEISFFPKNSVSDTLFDSSQKQKQ